MRGWSGDEVAILRAHYGDHGPDWGMWEILLPDRSERQIEWKARQIGLTGRSAPRETVIADKRHRIKARRPEPDPREKMVMGLMEQGLAPSEIDKRMKWRPGRTSLIVTEMWRRDNEREC